MRGKGSRFTLGVWGLRVCSLDVAFMFATVRNCSQPFATVRNRSRDGRMALPMVSSAEGVIFGGFTCGVASFREAGVVFCNVSKVGLCGRRSTFATFSQDELQFSWQALRTCPLSFCMAGAALETCRFACFCESHCQGRVKWRQGANSVASVAFCEMSEN